MALMACYECGGKVSTSASACPHCGAPSKQVVDQRVDPPALKQNPKLIAGLILAAAVGFIIFAVAIVLFSQSNHDSPETVSFINSEGSTLSCSSENRESCARDAERKGFVKLSDTVAGIAVDWTAKPLRIVGVRGAAADAGVRNGDILIELDGSEITEPFSIFRIMSTKHPGDKVTVKVSRADRQLYFAYNLMQRENTHLPPAPASNIDSLW